MTALRHGHRGLAVQQLQQRLNQAGVAVVVTGLFDDATQAAVQAYQLSRGLVADGIAGEKTQAALAGFDLSRLLSQRVLAEGAKRLSVELAAMLAVNEVESLGMGFLPNGKPKVLFERHVLHRRLQRPLRDSLVAQHPHLVNPAPGGYVGGEGEHTRLALARNLVGDLALEAASWGAFQVMGYHAERLGYASVVAFTDAMAEHEAAQFEAFLRFVEADPALHKALKAKRWEAFAERYNGPAYRRNLYDAKLARAYERHARALEVAA
jgi:hypothetical protein